MKAMIFSAGLGTRLKPLTDTKPKALIEIGGKTFLEIVVEKLKKFGVNEIVVNVYHLAEQITKYLKEKNNFDIKIHISDEREMLLDTGGGLKKAASLLIGDEPIILHNVDVLSNTDLADVVKHHVEVNALATIVVRERKSQRYLIFDETNQLIGWKNTETGEEKMSFPVGLTHVRLFAFSGIHVINPEIFNLLKQEGKFSIIDAYLELAKNHKIVGYLDNASFWMDIGKPGQLEEARKLVEFQNQG
jgi:N-acetyl-alpha-D-muramate 1-phosphate uridylyltransferase